MIYKLSICTKIEVTRAKFYREWWCLSMRWANAHCPTQKGDIWPSEWMQLFWTTELRKQSSKVGKKKREGEQWDAQQLAVSSLLPLSNIWSPGKFIHLLQLKFYQLKKCNPKPHLRYIWPYNARWRFSYTHRKHVSWNHIVVYVANIGICDMIWYDTIGL